MELREANFTVRKSQTNYWSRKQEKSKMLTFTKKNIDTSKGHF